MEQHKISYPTDLIFRFHGKKGFCIEKWSVINLADSLITDEMVNKFNQILQNEGSIIRLKRRTSSSTPHIVNISLMNDPYLMSHSPSLTDAFYRKLEGFFGGDINYNISKSNFWKFK